MKRPASSGRQVYLYLAMSLISLLIGLIGSEIMIRAYIAVTNPYVFRAKPGGAKGTLATYNVSYWEFDREFGYVYPPHRKVNLTLITDGTVRGCKVDDVINSYGNIGPEVPDYNEAEIKIALFGDSWAAFQSNGRTWPHALQEELERRLKRKVRVLNFGRDGYGILQMVTLARAKLREFKPDLALITFITDDIDRDRFWRTAVVKNGEMRVLTTLDPDPDPPLNRAADTFLLHPKATYEWCKTVDGKRDALVDEIEDKYARYISAIYEDRPETVSIFTLQHSFLYNLVVHRNAAYSVFRGYKNVQNPRITELTYNTIPGFVDEMKDLNGLGIPWQLIHLAYYPEVKEGTEYLLTPAREKLLQSLEDISGKKSLQTLNYTDLPVEKPERMNASVNNFHPSLWGMEFYAQAVSRMLIERGIVKP